eukprot:4346546-Alexandrium_andersonii.AAC.1
MAMPHRDASECDPTVAALCVCNGHPDIEQAFNDSHANAVVLGNCPAWLCKALNVETSHDAFHSTCDQLLQQVLGLARPAPTRPCLLYTSDAADDM